jgi:hypothetical protein
VTDPQTAAMQAILRRESRSFLQYIGDTLPWPAPENEEVEARLRPLIEEERAATAELGRFLVRSRVPLPYVGPYPAAFTTTNFISLARLLPPLIEEERRAVGALERELDDLVDPEARVCVQGLLDVKRRHLHSLEARTPPPPEPVAAAH